MGAGASLLYAAARVTRGQRGAEAEGATEGLVDWKRAEAVAIRAAGNAPTLHPHARVRLEERYRALLADIEPQLSQYTGTELSPGGTPVEVMDRPSWIRANMQSFRDILEPIETFYQEQWEAASAGRGGLFGDPARTIGRMTVSLEVGLLIGYFARRVLGQYDLGILAAEPPPRGKLYFVETNLEQLEQTLGLPGDDLRRWVALHEATHAHEFEVYPWVRTYMNGCMKSYLRLVVGDLRREKGVAMLPALVGRIASNLRQGHNVIMAFMTPEQREMANRLQALMSLAEGYSNHVMNAVGQSVLPNFAVLHERTEQRQKQRSHAEILFLKASGLWMKMEQYRRGEAFVDHVVREGGMALINRAWEAAENLPNEAEIGDPARWVRRMRAAA